MRKYSALFLVMIFFLLLSLPGPAFASGFENSFKVSKLNINLMPEYDKQEVLVLYGADFVNTSSEAYSGEVRFPVPQETSNNIVKEASSGAHLQVQVEESEGQTYFVWMPSQPIQPNATYSIHLEYYYNPLPGTGLKEFDYKFNPQWNVELAEVYFLEPFNSEEFKTAPAAAYLGQDDKGFNIYNSNFNNLKSGDPISVKVSYTRNDPNPSVQPPSAQSSNFTAQPIEQKGFDLMDIFLMTFLAISTGVVIFAAGKSIFNDSNKPSSTKSPGNSEKITRNNLLEQEKRKLRQRLLNGEIGEETYHTLLLEIEEDYR